MQGLIAVDGGVEIKSWLPLDKLEDGAFEQAWNCARHPKAFSHMALMPDCHQGYGMPIGGVMALKNAVSPAMVGVDIGCGMCAVPTDIHELEISTALLEGIAAEIRERIPCGEGKHRAEPVFWDGWAANEDIYKGKPWASNRTIITAKHSLGTLGGGNHFIEIQVDPIDRNLWIMLHSGSRGFGYRIAKHYMKVAEKMDPEGARLGVPALPLSTDVAFDYITDMGLALRFAQRNREVMLNDVKAAIMKIYPDTMFGHHINIHHNFAAMEEHFGEKVIVHRKGATQAEEEQLGIIPGSMGTMSCIVRGRGNPDSFRSCSHGAGRVMGRMAATRSLDLGTVEDSLSHVVFNGFNTIKKGKLKGKPDLGEAPQAYKDICEVMANQDDLVEVVRWLEPLAVVKG